MGVDGFDALDSAPPPLPSQNFVAAPLPEIKVGHPQSSSKVDTPASNIGPAKLVYTFYLGCGLKKQSVFRQHKLTQNRFESIYIVQRLISQNDRLISGWELFRLTSGSDLSSFIVGGNLCVSVESMHACGVSTFKSE